MKPRPRSFREATGYSLFELLVVIAIVALILGIILPTLGLVRSRGTEAWRLASTSQSIQAMTLYATEHGGANLFVSDKDQPHFLISFSWADHLARLADIDVRGISADTRETPPWRLLYTDTAVSRPAYWRLADPERTREQFRGTRVDEVVFPGAKGILSEYDGGVIVRRGGEVRGAFLGSRSGIIGFFDGSVGKGTQENLLLPHPSGPVAPELAAEAGLCCSPFFVMHTIDGVRGRDVSRR